MILWMVLRTLINKFFRCHIYAQMLFMFYYDTNSFASMHCQRYAPIFCNTFPCVILGVFSTCVSVVICVRAAACVRYNCKYMHCT